MAGARNRNLSPMAAGLETEMLIHEHMDDPARNAFSSAVSP